MNSLDKKEGKNSGAICDWPLHKHSSSMTQHLAAASNPKGWEIEAGGRSLAETSGEGLGGFLASWRDARGLRPLQGRLGIWDRGSGGGAARNHRLLSGKPSACGMADPKTNPIPALDAAGASCLHFCAQWRGASEVRCSAA